MKTKDHQAATQPASTRSKQHQPRARRPAPGPKVIPTSTAARRLQRLLWIFGGA